MKPALVLAAVAVVVAFADGTVSQASAPPPPIVFSADRAPSIVGEIWRLEPNGRRVDLSRSPYTDTDPAVSWNGKRVAFLSNRNGSTSVYEVAIDGRGLRRVGPTVLDPDMASCEPQLGWAPNGTLAVMVCGSSNESLWIVRPHHHPVKMLSDSKVDLFLGFSWSPQGLLAVQTETGTAAYDTSGHRRWVTPTGGSSRPLWSPDGSYLALSAGRWTVVLNADGQEVVREKLGSTDFAWADDHDLAVGSFGKCYCKVKLVDVRTGAVRMTSQRDVFATHSTDGRLVIVERATKHGYTLGARNVEDGSARTYGTIPACFNDGASEPSAGSLQFAGDSLVYESWSDCDPPFASLYSVGARIHRLTDAPAEETQPALAPDGTEIAYVWASATGLSCKGCSDGIRIASSDGRPLRTLSNPQGCAFDDSPSWSPDGQTIVYSETSCDNAGELFTLPATGGAPHDLGLAGTQPAWGPSKIAYAGALDTSGGIWIADPNGTNPTEVSPHGNSPTWSPSGELAYLVGKNMVVGQNVIQLPFQQVSSLRWSPDGTRLLIVGSREPSGRIDDLYSIKPDGSDLVRLTKNFGVTS